MEFNLAFLGPKALGGLRWVAPSGLPTVALFAWLGLKKQAESRNEATMFFKISFSLQRAVRLNWRHARGFAES